MTSHQLLERPCLYIAISPHLISRLVATRSGEVVLVFMKEETNHYVIAVLSPSIIDNSIFRNWSAIFPTLAYQDPGAHGKSYN